MCTPHLGTSLRIRLDSYATSKVVGYYTRFLLAQLEARPSVSGPMTRVASHRPIKTGPNTPLPRTRRGVVVLFFARIWTDLLQLYGCVFCMYGGYMYM